MSKVGTFVFLDVDGKILIGQTSLSMKDTITMIEVSSKSTGNTSAFVAGRSNSSISVGGLAATTKETTEAGYWELRAKALAGQPIPVTFTEYTDKTGATPTIGAEKMTASCLVSNVSAEFPDNDKITFSCDLQVTDSATPTTNA